MWFLSEPKNAPKSIWAAIPKSPTDASVGYEDITFARFNYAITRAARWLLETLGPQDSRPPKALAYIGPPDTRYIIFTIAAIKDWVSGMLHERLTDGSNGKITV